MRELSTKMTTTTTIITTSQAGSTTTPPKSGSNKASADVKAKATLEAKKSKEKAWQKQRKEKNDNNNNHAKFEGLILEGVMKDVTISTNNSATMTSNFWRYKKFSAVYAASKGYKHWPTVITNIEPVPDTKWKTKPPDKSLYATKRTTKIMNEDKSKILKQEWIVIDCETQDELKDNHTNIQC